MMILIMMIMRVAIEQDYEEQDDGDSDIVYRRW